MESEQLIDFSSPVKGSGNMLDPLVPLPTTGNILPYGSGASGEGDNPFDSVMWQICKKDDPFEIAEPRALNDSRQNEVLDEDEVYIHNSERETTSLCRQDIPSQDTSQVVVSETDVLEKKFSKLYASAQLEKQIMDESFAFVDSESLDVSDTASSRRSIEKSTENKVQSSAHLPSSENDVKAFVSERIEKCIEKALNESRRSINIRRSLSASALSTTAGRNPLSDLHNSFYRHSSRPCSPENSRMYSKCALNSSVHDFLSSRSEWKTPIPILDSSFGVCNRFVPRFSRSTPSVNIFPTKNSFEPLLNRSFATSGGRWRSTPGRPSLASGTSEIKGDDSVFLNGKSSFCVFLEAKNISGMLQRKVHSHDNLDTANSSDDEDFLTRDDWKVNLVDSDSESQASNEPDSLTGKTESNNQETPKEKELASSVVDTAIPLSRDTVKDIALLSRQLKKSPVLVAPPPVPVTAGEEGAVLKPKSQTQAGSRVAPKGPLKAMLPLGNMMRKKDSPVAGRQSKNSPAGGQGVSLTNRTSLAPQQRRPSSANQAEVAKVQAAKKNVQRKFSAQGQEKNSPPSQPVARSLEKKNSLPNQTAVKSQEKKKSPSNQPAVKSLEKNSPPSQPVSRSQEKKNSPPSQPVPASPYNGKEVEGSCTGRGPFDIPIPHIYLENLGENMKKPSQNGRPVSPNPNSGRWGGHLHISETTNKSSASKKVASAAESFQSRLRPPQTHFHEQRINSPVPGRPLACSTPSIDNVPSLVSPQLRLQLSNGNVPSVSPDVGRGRYTASSSPSGVANLGETPVRKLTRVRQDSDTLRRSHLALPLKKSSKLPGPTSSSTPLRTKNIAMTTPGKPMSPGVFRKLLQRGRVMEKENIHPNGQL